jgi:hypothetical protein
VSTLLNRFRDERDRGEETAGEDPFLDEIDFSLICTIVSPALPDQVEGSLTSLKSRLGHGNDLEASSALGVENPVQHGEVARNKVLASIISLESCLRESHIPNSLKHLDGYHTVELTSPAFWKTKIISSDHLSGTIAGVLSIVHQPDPDTSSKSSGFYTFFCEDLLLGREGDCVDCAVGQTNSLEVSLRSYRTREVRKLTSMAKLPQPDPISSTRCPGFISAFLMMCLCRQVLSARGPN